MKITNIISYISGRTYFVKVETDEGVSGFGQCSGMNNEAALQIIQNNIKPRLIGMSIFDAEKIEQEALAKNYKFAGQLLAMAFSGVEIAIWDAKGKYLKQPVYNLLGGRYRDTVEMYGSSMSRDLTVEQECEKIKRAVDKYGFNAVKIKVGPRMGNVSAGIDMKTDIDKVKGIRDVIGKNRKLILDGNSSFTYFQALQFYEAVKEYDIMIFEEPCPYYDLEAYIQLSQKLPIPINVGEQDWNIYTFRDFISKGAVQVCAADVTKCGGFINMKRIAALCRAYGILLSPHDTTTGVGMAAQLQFIASSPECNAYHEYSIELKTGSNYLINKFEVQDGLIKVPEGPGLGIELDIELIEKTMKRID